jgi:hypothetical protein
MTKAASTVEKTPRGVEDQEAPVAEKVSKAVSTVEKTPLGIEEQQAPIV